VAVEVRVARVQRRVEFAVRVVVERREERGPVAWPEDLVGLLDASPLTEPDAALVSAAHRLLESGDRGAALAGRVNAWVAGAMRYRHDVTTVRTPAAEALAVGQGVCQDYAHVMLALCRASGLPARYVSGHLVGEGGSHAWVEVLVEDGGGARAVAVAFDPTHGRRAETGYVTVAVGRDYADVAPTSGTFESPGRGRLSSWKRLDVDDRADESSLSAL
jgi:transglutaminase-like putative cysteine protease